MAIKDHTQHFVGLRQAPTVPAQQVPNTVSRGMMPGDRSFVAVVAEAGKPLLDSEINLRQEALWMQDFLQNRWNHASGWVKDQGHADTLDEFTFEAAPGVSDDSPGGGHIVGGGSVLVNALLMDRLEVSVAGYPLTIEFTNTSTAGTNLVTLSAPTVLAGPTTVKRTDFLFLEVWKSLVAPSPWARGTLTVVDASAVVAGNTFTLDGMVLTSIAVGPPAADQFVIDPASEANTATNIATAINDPGNSFSAFMVAYAVGGTVNLVAGPLAPGAAGNGMSLAVVAALGSMTTSGFWFTGGEDRPNKPAQNKLYRHGNTQSPTATWLDDDLADPLLQLESSQRVQLQYRIRATDATEGVNHKTQPDGFSTHLMGVPTIYAQGGRTAPVFVGNPAGDVNSYPFVPANGTNVWLQSSAAAYSYVDGGLWVAGSGNERSAQDLGAVDGFVYSIPLGFVFRHNNASNIAVASKGFVPLTNTNGAPTWGHGGYVNADPNIGMVPPGLSDRPDNHFCDVVTLDNMLDLRRHIVPSGIDTAGELQYQMQSLMDNRVRTWAVDTVSKQVLGNASGDVSTRYLVCNEIGRSAVAGDGPGSTDRGVFVRGFDHVARRFGDQSVVERVVFAFWPIDRAGAPIAPNVNNGKYVAKDPWDANKWAENDVLHLNLAALDMTTLGGLFDSRTAAAGTGGGWSGAGRPMFDQLVPPGTVITDVLGAWHDDGHYNAAVVQDVQFKSIAGLGTLHAELTLDANDITVTGGLPPGFTYQMVGYSGSPDDGSPRRIFVEFEITYPVGSGTTDLPDLTPQIAPDAVLYDGSTGAMGPGSVIEEDPTQQPVDLDARLSPRFRTGFREIQFEYVANDTIDPLFPQLGSPVGANELEEIVSLSPLRMVFPRRVYDQAGVPISVAVVDIPVPALKTVDVANSAFGSSSRSIILDVGTPLSGAGQTLANIRYFAQDPAPNYGVAGGGWQLAIYYRAVCPQTAGVREGDISTDVPGGVVPGTLTVRPLVMPCQVWTDQAGVGSNDESFPYSRPGYQVPINNGGLGTTEEWYFSANANVSVADFDAATGLLNLHAFVQQDIQDELRFGGVGVTEKPRADNEFRAFYPFADDTVYRPVVVAQEHSGAVRHKVMTPFLAVVDIEVPGTDGGLLYRKGELVLVVLSRFAEFDAENNVWFLDANNRTAAGVYRTRNMMLLM